MAVAVCKKSVFTHFSSKKSRLMTSSPILSIALYTHQGRIVVEVWAVMAVPS